MKHDVAEISCGMGGLGLGLKMAGFSTRVAMDIDDDAVESFKNNVSPNVFKGDIESESDRSIFITRARGCSLLAGGLPCQSYSTSGNRDPLEHRAYYYRYFMNIVGTLQPEVFLFENVPGILTMKVIDPNFLSLENGDLRFLDEKLQADLWKIRRKKDLERFKRQRELQEEEQEELTFLEGVSKECLARVEAKIVPVLHDFLSCVPDGYVVSMAILNACHHGSAQARKRFFAVGSRRKNAYAFPIGKAYCKVCGGSVFLDANGSCPAHGVDDLVFKTARDAIHDLIDKEEGCLPHHVFTRHSLAMQERMSRVPQGGNLYPSYSDAWWRLIENKPCRTIKENHNASGIHFSENRVLTPREMMRIQNFPDDFVVKGTKRSIMKQIGNAVDVKMAEALGKSILEHLKDE